MNPTKPITFLVALVAALSACKDDDGFDSVEPVKAPPATEEAVPVQEPSAMPADHPPVADPAVPAAGGPKMVAFSSPAEFGKTGPLRWTAPETWTGAKPASAMRLAEYVVPGPEGQGAGVVTVFYFGPGGGGGVEPNVQRWVGQFKTSGGAAAKAQRSTKEVSGMKVHTVAVAGTYNPGMAGNAPPKDGQRMLGAIVEAPAGLFFFKLVGPAATVAAAQGDFDAFVASMTPAS